MPQTFKIDQAATFASVIALSCEPKTKFQSTDQECTRDGVPKWEVQVLGAFRQFGKITNEVIKVGVASEKDPGQTFTPYTPVDLVGFEVGVMEKTGRDGQVIGAQTWYRADEIRPTSASGPAPSKPKAEASA